MDQTTCTECGEPITQPATGRRRLCCSGHCRQQASRRSRTVHEPVGTAHGRYSAPARSDDQVTFVLADLRVYVGALYRLGRECRPQLARRCESLGTAIDEALQRHFPEISE